MHYLSQTSVDILLPMKKTTQYMTPEQTVADLAHLAWCALVGLRLAQREGMSSSPLATHAFLLRWLVAAQKQKRFPRTVAPDIDSLIVLGRSNGPAAVLEKRFDYLWASCTGPLLKQSDLFRLTHAIEHLKSQGWINAVISDEEWCGEALSEEYRGVSALLVKKSDLVRHFSEEGALLSPVEFVVVGNQLLSMQVFKEHGLNTIVQQQCSGWSVMGLQPAQVRQVRRVGNLPRVI